MSDIDREEIRGSKVDGDKKREMTIELYTG